MTPNRLRVTASFLALVAMTAALSACGRRGPPEPPPSAVSTVPGEEVPEDDFGRSSNTPFFLDPVVE